MVEDHDTEISSPAPAQVAPTPPPLSELATARLFLSLPVPAPVHRHLYHALKRYPQMIERVLPHETWHLTLFFLGEVENPQQYRSRLLKILPQTYVPTVTLMHVGRGLHRTQLWAYAHPSTILLNLRSQVLERLRSMRFPLPKDALREFIPHIRLATLYPMARGIGMADEACNTTYSVSAVDLWRSDVGPERAHYTHEGSIILSGN